MENRGNPRKVRKSLLILIGIIAVAAIISGIGLFIEDKTDIIVDDDVHNVEKAREDNSGEAIDELEKTIDRRLAKAEKVIDKTEVKIAELKAMSKNAAEIEKNELKLDRLNKYKENLKAEQERLIDNAEVKSAEVKAKLEQWKQEYKSELNDLKE